MRALPQGPPPRGRLSLLREAYLRDAKEFGQWTVLQGLSLHQVQSLDVARFRETLRASGNSPATIKRKLSALRKLFSYLVETGVLVSNPAREVATEKVRVKGGKTPALSPEQMRQLFARRECDLIMR